MKWFQHDASASHDAKVKKLILRHGAEGYAVYFHCLELISGDLTQTNITFELEHDAEIIADNLKIKGDNQTAGIDKVNNILKTIIDIGLFETADNRIFCFKLASRLDNTVSRSAEINKIKKLRIDNVEPTKKLGAEENRIDNNKIQESTVDKITKEVKPKPPKHKYGEYQNVMLSDTDLSKVKDLYPNDYLRYIEEISLFVKSKDKPYKDYVAGMRTWSNNDKKWNKLGKPTDDFSKFYEVCGGDK